MESNNNLLESKILEISNGDVVKKKKNYYIPVFLMILGLCLVMFNVQSQSVEADKINTVLFFVGAIAIVAGAAFMFLQKEQYLHKPSGKILKKSHGLCCFYVLFLCVVWLSASYPAAVAMSRNLTIRYLPIECRG